MPSDSVASFLQLARSQRVLPPDEVDELLREPGAPQENLAALSDYLVARGAVTPYQADLVRAGKGAELTFAGYPVVDDLGPCPGGSAYRVLHPSLRTPLVLRRLRADWLGPADNVAAFVKRAQEACPVVHANLAHLLDAGVFLDEPFVTMDQCAGADLQTLVSDIGPMPASLAADYARQLASGLAAAHERGVVHGEVRPAVAFVAPLVSMSKPNADGTPRFRPAANAVVKLSELGLVPRRPPVGEWDAPADLRPYLAPERNTSGEPTPAGDVYALGVTVYYLLAGRPPAENSPPLAAVRPDVPASLVAIAESLMRPDPSDRPSAAQAAERFAAPDTPPPEPVVALTPDEPDVPLAAALAEPEVPLAAEMPSDEWVAVPVEGVADPAAPEFIPQEYAPDERTDEPAGWSPQDEPTADPTPSEAKRAEKPAPPKRNVWLWIGVGLGLNLLAVAGWIYLAMTPGCSGSGDPDPPVKKTKAKKG